LDGNIIQVSVFCWMFFSSFYDINRRLKVSKLLQNYTFSKLAEL